MSNLQIKIKQVKRVRPTFDGKANSFESSLAEAIQ